MKEKAWHPRGVRCPTLLMSKPRATKTVHSIDRWGESRRREPVSQAPKDTFSGNTARAFQLLNLYGKTGCLSDPPPSTAGHESRGPQTSQALAPLAHQGQSASLSIYPCSLLRSRAVSTPYCAPTLCWPWWGQRHSEWQQWQFWLEMGPCTLSSFLASTPTIGGRPLSRGATTRCTWWACKVG